MKKAILKISTEKDRIENNVSITAPKTEVGFFFEDRSDEVSLLESEYMLGGKSSTFIVAAKVNGNTDAKLMYVKEAKDISKAEADRKKDVFKQILVPVKLLDRSSWEVLNKTTYDTYKRNLGLPDARLYEDYSYWITKVEQYDRYLSLGYNWGDRIPTYVYKTHNGGGGLLYFDYIVPLFSFKYNNESYCLIFPRQVIRVYYTLKRCWSQTSVRYADFRLTRWESRFKLDKPHRIIIKDTAVQNEQLGWAYLDSGHTSGNLNWGKRFSDTYRNYTYYPGTWNNYDHSYPDWQHSGGIEPLGPFSGAFWDLKENREINDRQRYFYTNYWANSFKTLDIDVIIGDVKTEDFTFTPAQWENGVVVNGTDVRNVSNMTTDTSAGKSWYGPWFNWTFTRWANVTYYDENGVFKSQSRSSTVEQGWYWSGAFPGKDDRDLTMHIRALCGDQFHFTKSTKNNLVTRYSRTLIPSENKYWWYGSYTEETLEDNGSGEFFFELSFNL